MTTYLINLLIWLSQGLNTITFGDPDETFSARAHRDHKAGRSVLRNFVNGLFFWQEDHCQDAYWVEVNRKHLPNAYADKAGK